MVSVKSSKPFLASRLRISTQINETRGDWMIKPLKFNAMLSSAIQYMEEMLGKVFKEH